MTDILVYSFLRNLVGKKNIVAPALFTCLCGEEILPALGCWVFLSVLPSQACDRGFWLHCNVWVVSEECFLPAQPWTSHLLEEADISIL